MSSTNIYVEKHKTHTPNTISIATFNISNAWNDEKDASNRFGTRVQLVIDELKKSKADIICLQEIREYRDLKNYTISPMQSCMMFADALGMDIAACQPVGITKGTWWRLTLYNSRKFFHLKSENFWINKNKMPHVPGQPQRWGNLAVRSLFAPYREVDVSKIPRKELDSRLLFVPKKTFAIVNMHFPHKLEYKMETAEFIRDLPLISTFQIALGDFNTFYDDGNPDHGKGGQEMMDLMATGGYVDLLPNYPTFSSFPADHMQLEHRLDHAVIKGNYKHMSSMVYDNSKYEKRPSDHYMCVVNVELN
jgi:endonuclease/exonuclease/phosphatase family metal-dependent hydrolase